MLPHPVVFPCSYCTCSYPPAVCLFYVLSPWWQCLCLFTTGSCCLGEPLWFNKSLCSLDWLVFWILLESSQLFWLATSRIFVLPVSKLFPWLDLLPQVLLLGWGSLLLQLTYRADLVDKNAEPHNSQNFPGQGMVTPQNPTKYPGVLGLDDLSSGLLRSRVRLQDRKV